MYIYAKKDLSSNLSSLSNEFSYIINKLNGIIYFSAQIGVSLEYVVDKLMTPTAHGIFIYEDYDSDEISIIFINNINDTVNFNLKLNYSPLKLENFIKIICFQNNVASVYFFENSKVEKSITLPDYITKSYISRSDFKKTVKKTSAVKSRKNKLVSLGVFLLLIFVFEFAIEKSLIYLTNKSNATFNQNYSLAETKKTSLQEELGKYEDLSMDLKDIEVVKTISEYINIQQKEINNGVVQ